MAPEMSGALDTLPRLLAANMPVVTREQMRDVDRLMIEEFGIQLLKASCIATGDSTTVSRATTEYLISAPIGWRTI